MGFETVFKGELFNLRLHLAALWTQYIKTPAVVADAQRQDAIGWFVSIVRPSVRPRADHSSGEIWGRRVHGGKGKHCSLLHCTIHTEMIQSRVVEKQRQSSPV